MQFWRAIQQETDGDAHKFIQEGSYGEALQLPSCQLVLQTCLSALSTCSNSPVETDLQPKLVTAVCCLQLFVQHNWTGPMTLSEDKLCSLFGTTVSELAASEAAHKAYLMVDGETVYDHMRYPTLLAISRDILSHPGQRDSSPLWRLWQLRSIFAHQSFLDERCASLRLETLVCVDCLAALSNGEEFLSDSDSTSLLSWRLEAAHMAGYYFEHKTWKHLLKKALQESGVTVEFTGLPGRRTKYQQKDLAQLVLRVGAPSDVERPPVQPVGSLPKNLPLNDDTVLDSLQLSEGLPESSQRQLTSEEQALLLAMCECNRYVKGEDSDITEEESMAFLRYVLDFPTSWCVQFKSLYLRSLIEKRSSRRLERSICQLEELSSLISLKEGPSVSQRLHLVYCTALPAVWHVQRSLGELHMEAGCFASALEVFERLSLWNPLIVCCQKCGRTGKAEAIIRERLLVEETPVLYCSLSDVTGDPQYYIKAWELSAHRSARAVRGLAMHYLRACSFEKAVEFFDMTLAINSLQKGCWFSCGCAALSLQRYDKAASCFQRCVMLDEDNFEAWNNLAAAYARSGQKSRAFCVLQDAIKCSYDDWRVWENYLLLGTDCGQFAEVIRAAHRLLELSRKWADEQVLEVLTKAVKENLLDAQGKPCAGLRAKLAELFGHVTSAVTNNAKVWQLYGELLMSTENCTPDDIDRAIQLLQKGYRCAFNSPSWEKDVNGCESCTQQLCSLLDAYAQLDITKYIGTARLQIKGHIARLRHAQSISLANEPDVQISTMVLGLEKRLGELGSAGGLTSEKLHSANQN